MANNQAGETFTDERPEQAVRGLLCPFSGWIQVLLEKSLSRMHKVCAARCALFQVNRQPKSLTPLYHSELAGGLSCPLALVVPCLGAFPRGIPDGPHAYRLQPVLLSLALVGAIDEGTCGDFVVVQ